MQHREGEVMQGTLDQERKGQAGRGRPFLQWKPLHCVNMHSCSSLLVPPTILSILITPAPRTLLSPRTISTQGRPGHFLLSASRRGQSQAQPIVSHSWSLPDSGLHTCLLIPGVAGHPQPCLKETVKCLSIFTLSLSLRRDYLCHSQTRAEAQGNWQEPLSLQSFWVVQGQRDF